MEMRKQFSQLQERSASAQSQMERTQRLLDRIRRDNVRKSTEIDKLQQEFTSLGDRLKMLENKAMEVEKLEITVDSLKKALEASQQEVRDAERQIKYLERKVEEKDKIISSTEVRMKDLEKLTTDLKLQIREEVIRNTNLEMRIENTERLREQLAEKDAEIESLKKKLEDAALLTQHARKCLREERDRRKHLENMDRDIEQMKEEVEIISSENTTLKRLLAAKDVIFRQKLQVIQNLQNALKDRVTPQQYRNIMRSIEIQTNDVTDVSQRRYLDGVSSKSVEAVNGASHVESDQVILDSRTFRNERLLKTILKENISATARPKTAIVNPRMYHDSFSNFRSESPTCSDVTSTISDASSNRWREGSGLRRSQSVRGSSVSGSRSTVTSASIDCITAWAAKRPDSRVNGYTGEDTGVSRDTVSKVMWSDRHVRCTGALEVGDRVVFETVTKKGDHSKEYNTGVIKYIGPLEGEKDPARTYVGLKLDEPGGDTDGLHKGKRYFRVSMRHGKFIRIERIRSIFDKQTGQFKSTESSPLNSNHHHTHSTH